VQRRNRRFAKAQFDHWLDHRINRDVLPYFNRSKPKFYAPARYSQVTQLSAVVFDGCR
jgi:hypothetical protein